MAGMYRPGQNSFYRRCGVYYVYNFFYAQHVLNHILARFQLLSNAWLMMDKSSSVVRGNNNIM